MRLTVLLAAALMLVSCGPSLQKLQSATDMASERDIIARASHDLECPKENIKALRVAGAVTGNLVFGAPNGTWVAEGCGKKSTYQVMCQCGSGLFADSCSKDYNTFRCSPMLESTQSSNLMQQNATQSANVATQQAQQAATRQMRQQQQQQALQRQQQQMNESFARQNQNMMNSMQQRAMFNSSAFKPVDGSSFGTYR